MKQLTAIWFSLLLVLAQIVPASMAATSPNCCKLVKGKLPACCAQMPCCVAKSEAPSQRAPVAPTPSGKDTQISLIAAVKAIWVLPGHEANVFSSAQLSPITMADAPLYERHCALLL